MIPLVLRVCFDGFLYHTESFFNAPGVVVLLAQFVHAGIVVGPVAQSLLEVADGTFGVLAVLALKAVREVGGVLLLVGLAVVFRFHLLRDAVEAKTTNQGSDEYGFYLIH